MIKIRVLLALLFSSFLTANLISQKMIGYSHDAYAGFLFPFTSSIYYYKPFYKHNQRFCLCTYQDRRDIANRHNIPRDDTFKNEWRVGFNYSINIIPARFRLMCYISNGISYSHDEYVYSKFSRPFKNPSAPKTKTTIDHTAKSLKLRNGYNFEYRIGLLKKLECIIGYSHYVFVTQYGNYQLFENYQLSPRSGIYFVSAVGNEIFLRVGIQYQIDRK